MGQDEWRDPRLAMYFIGVMAQKKLMIIELGLQYVYSFKTN